MDPSDLENALAIRANCEDVGDSEVVWVDPPPHFNAQPTMYTYIAEGRAHAGDPDLLTLMHLHDCEYRATGYFGNEGFDYHQHLRARSLIFLFGSLERRYQPGHTPGMKTAVSIPDDVFEQAERLARRMKKSRSELFSNALAEYLARHAPDHVTETMNQVCAEVGAKPDAFVSTASRRTLERSEW